MTRKNRTEAGSPIVESRVSIRASGGSTEKVVKKAVVERNGRMFAVPVDQNGRVPEDALICRFLDTSVGPRGNGVRRLGADVKKTARKTYPMPDGGFTPEQLIDTGWWDDPGSCDIEGIDDGYGPTMDFGPGMGRFERATGGKIAILAPTEAEKRHIASVLDENFTVSELKAAAWKYGLIIKIAKPEPGCTGHCKGRQSSVDTPEIVLEPNPSDETIVHEFCHHLRAVDPSRSGLTKTPYSISADDRELPPRYQENFEAKCTLEEAGTVAETTGRTKGLDKTESGYYWMIPKPPNGRHDGQGNFEADRELLTGGVGEDSRPLQGKRLMDAVEENFDDTSISRMKYKGRKSAMGYVKQLREEEALPPRRMPTKKPAPKKRKIKKPRTQEEKWVDAFLNGEDPWEAIGKPGGTWEDIRKTGGKKR